YKGANVTVHKKLVELRNTIKTLEKDYLLNIGLLVAKDLENILFELQDDDIIAVIGLIPRTNTMYEVDYNSLNEVIEHILNLPTKNYIDDLYVPDFHEKIKFNGLSKIISNQLENAAINYGDIELYFHNQSDFLREDIKNRFKELYNEAKNKISDGEKNFSDRRYMYILEKSMPKENNRSIQQAVQCLMAFYFESCDIFESPED
ncbi:MAG: ABC-three component system protein, partial [Sarcina sp.]